MKKLILTAAILVSCLTFKNAGAQIHFSIGLNINSQPDWGPVGYDRAAYYYIPDVDGYYDVNAHQYIYLENNVWVHRAYLPVRYRNYDLYSGYKFVVNEPNPWLRASVYRTRYASYRGRRGQAVIVNSRDVKYRNHWHDANAYKARRLNNRAHNLNQRDNHLDNRAHNLNQKDHRLDSRQHNLNQRDQHLDQKAKRLDQKQHKLNEKEHHNH